MSSVASLRIGSTTSSCSTMGMPQRSASPPIRVGGCLVSYLGASNGREFLSDSELNTFVDSFVDSGITGSVNWYRNIDANALEFASYKDAPITQPTLIIAADSDPVLPLSLVEGMGRWVPDLSVVLIDDCGHWTQQEKPDQVNRALLQWLESHE